MRSPMMESKGGLARACMAHGPEVKRLRHRRRSKRHQYHPYHVLLLHRHRRRRKPPLHPWASPCCCLESLLPLSSTGSQLLVSSLTRERGMFLAALPCSGLGKFLRFGNAISKTRGRMTRREAQANCAVRDCCEAGERQQSCIPSADRKFDVLVPLILYTPWNWCGCIRRHQS